MKFTVLPGSAGAVQNQDFYIKEAVPPQHCGVRDRLRSQAEEHHKTAGEST